MAGMKIIIEMRGMLVDDGQVKAEDFVEQIELLLKALGKTDKIVSQKEKPTISYRIVDMSHSHPKIVLGLYPILYGEDYTDEIGRLFLSTIEDINTKGEVPSNFDYDALEAYKNIGNIIDKGISELIIRSNGHRYDIRPEYQQRIQLIQGSDETARGSLSGKVEAINIHTYPYRFTLYPLVGPSRVKCNFPTKLKNEAIASIDKYVTVFGIIKYRHKAIYPYEIDVDFIEPPTPPETLPKFSDIKGIAPDLTKGMSSEEYVRKNRDLDG